MNNSIFYFERNNYSIIELDLERSDGVYMGNSRNEWTHIYINELDFHVRVCIYE